MKQVNAGDEKDDMTSFSFRVNTSGDSSQSSFLLVDCGATAHIVTSDEF